MPSSSERQHLRGGAWTRYGRGGTGSGGPTDPPPITPPPPSGGSVVVRPELPFDPPTRDVLTASPYKVFPHYFPFYPLSISNKAYGADYYDTVWMPPGVIEGTTDHRVYGGMLRDRPPSSRAVSTATATVALGGVTPVTTPRWKVDDRRTEIEWAADAGFDGFFVNMMGSNLDSPNYQNYRYYLEIWQAAQERWDTKDKTFTLVCQPDASTSAAKTVAQLAADLNWLAKNRACTFKNPTGDLLVAPYGPDFAPANAKNDPNFWTNLRSTMTSTYGITVDLWNVFSSDWLNNTSNTSGLDAPAMNAYSYGHSRWGMRNPVDNASTSTGARGAAAYCWSTFGKPWMPPVSPTDERAKGGSFNECRNSENWRMTWQYAIEQQATGHVPWVIIPTWSDYSENAHICPSTNHGFSLLDIGLYYLIKFKTGTYPKIVRPCIYLSHRVQPVSGVTYTADPTIYTKRMTRVGGTPEVDQIEALVFLPEQATVTITVNGTTVKSQVCAPGVTPVTAPLGMGAIAAKVVSTATGQTIAQAKSPWAVSTTQQVQDLNYRYFSSLRGA